MQYHDNFISLVNLCVKQWTYARKNINGTILEVKVDHFGQNQTTTVLVRKSDNLGTSTV